MGEAACGACRVSVLRRFSEFSSIVPFLILPVLVTGSTSKNPILTRVAPAVAWRTSVVSGVRTQITEPRTQNPELIYIRRILLELSVSSDPSHLGVIYIIVRLHDQPGISTLRRQSGAQVNPMRREQRALI